MSQQQSGVCHVSPATISLYNAVHVHIRLCPCSSLLEFITFDIKIGTYIQTPFVCDLWKVEPIVNWS